ncbi:hypothetical protein EYZ11_006428 [Aspergillus tanneri]|uniref:Velvet domain-containing protein n=1 Tax=Aspergillus tanneri TaxID=1220188 RepID=A0A4S3JFI7_9EURO|nr:uncharacterized protein ATNIH1004_004757 [Aspergillus tanneri]KAA8648871.1 hypothetical protein ATNIH1004_004757 [Aspergillus tanneri]THC94099.1 hypothetical protein EYZ11_006428 [Aspergillus tanneri]
MPFAKQPMQQQHQQRHATSGMPMGFEKLLNHSPAPSPPPRRPSTSSRYHLHIRQQPIAARACGAGDRDRRPVDPPPIIQILLTDFDPNSDQDTDILQDPRFTVGCLLVPVQVSPEVDGENTAREDRAGAQRAEGGTSGPATPLLSGKSFVSPFYVDADPDPATAPAHPSSEDYAANMRRQPMPLVGMKQPAAFYIFSDLSVRTAGLYRLQFQLMNWGCVEDAGPGQSMPILAEAWSDPFRVYPAKDFPGMRDSSPLAEGLKELGFVELKTRGKGRGKGRRR